MENDQKLCVVCQKILPRQSFGDDPEQYDGVKRTCLECEKVAYHKKKGPHSKNTTPKRRAIQQFTAKAIQATNVPDIIKVLDSVVTHFGSFDAVGAELVNTYHAAPAGSQSRVRILIATMRLMLAVVPLKRTADWIDMPSDELEAVVLKMFQGSKSESA